MTRKLYYVLGALLFIIILLFLCYNKNSSSINKDDVNKNGDDPVSNKEELTTNKSDLDLNNTYISKNGVNNDKNEVNDYKLMNDDKSSSKDEDELKVYNDISNVNLEFNGDNKSKIAGIYNLDEDKLEVSKDIKSLNLENNVINNDEKSVIDIDEKSIVAIDENDVLNIDEKSIVDIDEKSVVDRDENHSNGNLMQKTLIDENSKLDEITILTDNQHIQSNIKDINISDNLLNNLDVSTKTQIEPSSSIIERNSISNYKENNEKVQSAQSFDLIESINFNELAAKTNIPEINQFYYQSDNEVTPIDEAQIEKWESTNVLNESTNIEKSMIHEDSKKIENDNCYDNFEEVAEQKHPLQLKKNIEILNLEVNVPRTNNFISNEIVKQENLQETAVNEISQQENIQGTDINEIFKQENLQETDVSEISQQENLQETDVNEIFKQENLQETDVNEIFKQENVQENDVNEIVKQNNLQENEVKEISQQENIQNNDVNDQNNKKILKEGEVIKNDLTGVLDDIQDSSKANIDREVDRNINIEALNAHREMVVDRLYEFFTERLVHNGLYDDYMKSMIYSIKETQKLDENFFKNVKIPKNDIFNFEMTSGRIYFVALPPISEESILSENIGYSKFSKSAVKLIMEFQKANRDLLSSPDQIKNEIEENWERIQDIFNNKIPKTITEIVIINRQLINDFIDNQLTEEGKCKIFSYEAGKCGIFSHIEDVETSTFDLSPFELMCGIYIFNIIDNLISIS